MIEATYEANVAAPAKCESDDGKPAVFYPSYDLKLLRYPFADAQQAMVMAECEPGYMDRLYQAAGLPTSKEKV